MAGLALYPVLHAGRLLPLLGLLAVTGLAGAAAAPHTGGRFAWVAVFALAIEYTVAEAAGRVPAVSVAAYAVGLIILSELLLWAAQLPRSGRADRAVAGQQLILLAVLALAAAVLALATLAATGLRLPGAWAAALLGAAAAAALLALPWLILRGGHREHGQQIGGPSG